MATHWKPSRIRPAALFAAAMSVTATWPDAQAGDPAALLRAAREAIGGDAKVLAVKGLRLTGTRFATQLVIGGYTQDTEEPLQIRFALPDRFLEVSALTFGPDVFESQAGFVGERIVNIRNGERRDGSRQETHLRKKAAELLLLLLHRTEDWGGMTFEAAGPHAGQVRGPDGYSARLDFDPTTHALDKLTYRDRRQIRPRNTILRRGQAPARTGSRSGGSARSGQTADLPEIEIAITLHDRRDVAGIRLPHRITTTAVAENALLWELRFEKIEINPPLTDADFGG